VVVPSVQRSMSDKAVSRAGDGGLFPSMRGYPPNGPGSASMEMCAMRLMLCTRHNQELKRGGGGKEQAPLVLSA